MVISNEPGYYEDGKYGCRIENLMEIRYVRPELNEAAEQDVEESNIKEESKSAGKKFLRFEKLTMIPIQKSLIELDLMTEAELDWLDAYHENVFNKVSLLLEGDNAALTWLRKACEKIERDL
jgi:Xaa-Pro aminopeptidase